MLNIIKYIKRAYVMSVASNLHHGLPDNIPSSTNTVENEKKNPFDWGISEDLKQLKDYLSDWKIDSQEAKKIAEHLEDIDAGAQEWLNEVANNMIENGFSALDHVAYNSFSKIARRTWVKLPGWNELLAKAKVNDKFKNWVWEMIKDPNFHWVIVKEWEIQVRYDGWWMADTYIAKIDNSWKIIDWSWQGRSWDNNDVNRYAEISEEVVKDLDTRLAESESNWSKKVSEIAKKIKETNEVLPNWLSKEVNDFIEKNPNLSVSDWKVFYKVDGHNYFFTISRNPKMSTQVTNWKWDKVLKESKYSKSLIQWINSVNARKRS